MIVSAAAILSGLLCHYAPLVIVGAVIHLAYGVADLFQHYHDSKLFRSDTLPDLDSTISVRVTKWIEGTITLTGLVLVIATQRNVSSGYAIAGYVIWLGALVCYLVAGWIAQEVGGVPLRMGYGGWEIRRRKRRLRR